MPYSNQQAILAMANVFPEAPSEVAGIFMTNCFDMPGSRLVYDDDSTDASAAGTAAAAAAGTAAAAAKSVNDKEKEKEEEEVDEEEEEQEQEEAAPKCALYVALARLNHSCTPNVQQSHLPRTGAFVDQPCVRRPAVRASTSRACVCVRVLCCECRWPC